MLPNLSNSWSDSPLEWPNDFQVAVGSSQPDKVLGVQDGFNRYFREALGNRAKIEVSSHPDSQDGTGIPLTDEDILARAHDRVLRLQSSLESKIAFYACSEVGLHTLAVGGRLLNFVRTWTVVLGPPGSAFGGSGSIQLPEQLEHGLGTGAQEAAFAIPGTRRKGGMTASLTGGIETRRKAVEQSTLHALSTLFYSQVEGRGSRGR